MACACGGRKTRPFGPSSTTTTTAAPTTYVLRTPTGTLTFGSRLEAEAAKRRQGGGAIVTRR